MMVPPISKRPVNLVARLKDAVTAHQAVAEGIATHVQKEHAKRLDRLRQQKADSALLKPGDLSRGTL